MDQWERIIDNGERIIANYPLFVIRYSFNDLILCAFAYQSYLNGVVIHHHFRFHLSCSVIQFCLMAKAKKRSNEEPVIPPARTNFPVVPRVSLAIILPFIIAVVVIGFTGNATGLGQATNSAPVLAVIGIVSWIMSLFWYGLPYVGMRGKRPLFAGIGFATLGWVTFLLLRGVLLPVNVEPTGATRAFVYILLFEAFATQLWTFGLIFRSVAEWRGPLTGAFVSGIVFGGAAFVLFQESYLTDLFTLLYFMGWGVFYGMIRLRTGSFLGTFMIQAMQTFTAWIVLGSFTAEMSTAQLHLVYGLSGLAYAIFIWRLWPKELSDYRV